MATLGEAYVAVKADLRSFTKDLRSQLKKAVDDFEKDINEQLGVSLERGSEKAGEKAGKGLSRGMKRQLGDRHGEPWINMTGALASALDDGISALPAEIKAALVIGIGAALPFLSAGITGALVAGIGVGAAGLGVALASQFEVVQDRWTNFINSSRESLVKSAAAFVPAIINSLNAVEDRIESWDELLKRIFSSTAGYLEPLTEGALRGVEEFLNSLDVSSDEIAGFINELGFGFEVLGDAIGDALEILADTGKSGEQGLRDLIAAMALLIVNAARVLAFFTEVYDIVRQIAFAVPEVTALFGIFTRAVGEAGDQQVAFKQGVNSTATSFDLLIGQTQKQEQASRAAARAIEEEARAMDQARNAAFSLIDAQIAFEDSLYRISVALKKNGDDLSYETEKGRANLALFSGAIREAQRIAEERYAKGEIDAATAIRLYDTEIGRIMALANAGRITKDEFNKAFGSIIKVANLPKPDPTFWNRLIGWAAALARETARAVANAQRLRKMQGSGATIPWGAGIPEFAAGGIVNSETIARVGESGPEVVIPLTRPQRAAQLMDQSGLGRMLGAAASTVVQVFIGDEQLEQRMYRVAQDNNRSNFLALSYGPR